MTTDHRPAKTNGFLSAALRALDLGLRPIPCHPDGKRPLVRWEEFQQRPPTEEEVRRWWADRPTANVAVLTGEVGFDVVDLDAGHDPWPPEGCELPTAYVVGTPRGGQHYGFRHVPGAHNTAGALAKGVDTRADGGFVLVAPSVVQSKPYRVLLGSLAEGLTTEAPEWLKAALLNGKATAGDALPPGDDTIPEGQRNSRLTSLAGSLQRRGASQATIEAALLAENEVRCQPPLDPEEVHGIAASVARYAPAGEAAADDYHLTDEGNAQRLVDEHGEEIRYCPQRRTWLLWDGTRWAPDETGQIFELARKTIRHIFAEAEIEGDSAQRKLLVAHALASERGQRLEVMVTKAQSMPGIPVEPAQLDALAHLLNSVNGTVDLRTGELLPHRRGDLLTKLAPVAYDPEARCELWEQFLGIFLPGSLASFAQRCVGYAASAAMTEERLFILHGPTLAGKSTFLDAVRSTLGDYATTADFESFLQRRDTGGPRPGIVALVGRRFVSSCEVDEGRRLAQALVKTMTGGDPLRIRDLYERSFEVRPTWTLFLACNHRPVVADDDDALWRRLVEIPFGVRLPDDRRDPTIKLRLRNPAECGPGILKWVVDGCLVWRKHGLQVPQQVVEATGAYRKEMNPLADFLAQWCVLRPDAWCPASELRQAYENWCQAEGERELLPGKAWGEHLRAVGCERERKMRGHGWRGIGLVENATREPGEEG